MHWASETYLKAARRVLRYIKGGTNSGIKFKKNKDFKLLGFFDIEWTRCTEDMKNTSRYCFNLLELFHGVQRNKKQWLNLL